MKARILDIDHFSVHDGPGIRTVIYLKGCPLHCMWCHSPESQDIRPQILYASNRCVQCGICAEICPQHLHVFSGSEHYFVNRDQCILCQKCVRNCLSRALYLSGKEMTLEEVFLEASQDAAFFRNSGGGVTISGGEVLLWSGFVTELLKRLKEVQIHTIVETSGAGNTEELLGMCPYTECFYYDYKLGDPSMFSRYIGAMYEVVMKNLRILSRSAKKIVLRMPMIPGITDTEENVAKACKMARELGIHDIDLLPYNYSAGAKYSLCGKKYALEALRDQKQSLERLLKYAGNDLHLQIME